LISIFLPNWAVRIVLKFPFYTIPESTYTHTFVHYHNSNPFAHEYDVKTTTIHQQLCFQLSFYMHTKHVVQNIHHSQSNSLPNQLSNSPQYIFQTILKSYKLLSKNNIKLTSICCWNSPKITLNVLLFS